MKTLAELVVILREENHLGCKHFMDDKNIVDEEVAHDERIWFIQAARQTIEDGKVKEDVYVLRDSNYGDMVLINNGAIHGSGRDMVITGDYIAVKPELYGTEHCLWKRA